jgi:hypothetical protein
MAARRISTIRRLAAAPEPCQQMGDRARKAFGAELDKSISIARWELAG